MLDHRDAAAFRMRCGWKEDWCGGSHYGPGPQGFAVVVALSVSHLLNDTLQSLIAAVYPVLTFAQIGLITLAFQLTASTLQPLVGLGTDRRPMPFSLAAGMGASLAGLLLLAVTDTFPLILLAAGVAGLRSGTPRPGVRLSGRGTGGILHRPATASC